MIRTSYFGAIPRIIAVEKEPILVAICRWKPKAFNGFWMPQLAPSVELLMAYKNGKVTPQQYVERYRKEQEGSDLLQRMIKRAEGKNVFLLCYEKPGDFCHRHLLGLKEWNSK